MLQYSSSFVSETLWYPAVLRIFPATLELEQICRIFVFAKRTLVLGAFRNRFAEQRHLPRQRAAQLRWLLFKTARNAVVAQVATLVATVVTATAEVAPASVLLIASARTLPIFHHSFHLYENIACTRLYDNHKTLGESRQPWAIFQFPFFLSK